MVGIGMVGKSFILLKNITYSEQIGHYFRKQKRRALITAALATCRKIRGHRHSDSVGGATTSVIAATVGDDSLRSSRILRERYAN